jgi:hypothetical protein
VRSILDDAYQRLLGVMMSTIERLAASDPKYGNKLRLENTSALLDTISTHSVHVPVLASFQDRLARAKEDAVQVRCLMLQRLIAFEGPIDGGNQVVGHSLVCRYLLCGHFPTTFTSATLLATFLPLL